MKKRRRLAGLALGMWAAAALWIGTGNGVLQAQAAQADLYRAPAYGTRASHEQKQASYEQIQEVSEALQPLADDTLSRTASHNVSLSNYSDPDGMGLVYESEGSGVILAMDEQMVYIATASHCLKHAHTEITFPDGTVSQAVAVYRNPAKDVGFAVVYTSELSGQTLSSILPAAGANAQEAGKLRGDVLTAVSSSDGPNASAYIGVLDAYSVSYPNNPSQYVLQFFSEASYGSSGGGVYTTEGIWVGSISGGDTYGTCWAVPYSDILAEFQYWQTLHAAQMSGE
ncbi:MAG: serine protease [Eubacteriales bacterium]|nr:serine protease [Eubacteriales bacterium]